MVFDRALRDRLLYHHHDNLGKMKKIGGVGVELKKGWSEGWEVYFKGFSVPCVRVQLPVCAA